MNVQKYKSAFTMAEILITLLVIAVIASMTLPGLRKYAQTEEYIASLKKAYATLATTTRLIESEKGDMKRWGSFTYVVEDNEEDEESNTSGFDTTQRVAKYYAEKMNVARDCGLSGNNCWASSTKQLDGSGTITNAPSGGGAYTFSTGDGMNWQFQAITKENIEKMGVTLDADSPDGFLVWVDTNGRKNPNMVGQDVFAFIINEKLGVLPTGINSSVENKCDDSHGELCTAKVIKEGKMDY